jgi:lipid-binding SYLF domain-containing protein
MRFLHLLPIILTMLLLLSTCAGRKSQGDSYADSAGRINDAIVVLNEMVSVPEKSITREVLHDAAGIAVIPGVVKASAFFGGGIGKGVMSVRKKDSSWSYPSFITTEAHSLGWQVGIEKMDLVLVFKTENSIEKFLQDNLTLGVSVSAAAGPLGRYGSASTDAQLNSEIYSYVRTKGLFLGASLDGSIFRIDNNSNASYYRAHYISAKDIFNNKIPSQANLDLADKFVKEIESISQSATADSTKR